MAGATLVVMPVVVGCGTLFGSLLRRLSRRAQEQGARATAAGEECISNIRTGMTLYLTKIRPFFDIFPEVYFDVGLLLRV